MGAVLPRPARPLDGSKCHSFRHSERDGPILRARRFFASPKRSARDSADRIENLLDRVEIIFLAVELQIEQAHAVMPLEFAHGANPLVAALCFPLLDAKLSRLAANFDFAGVRLLDAEIVIPVVMVAVVEGPIDLLSQLRFVNRGKALLEFADVNDLVLRFVRIDHGLDERAVDNRQSDVEGGLRMQRRRNVDRAYFGGDLLDLGRVAQHGIFEHLVTQPRRADYQ